MITATDLEFAEVEVAPALAVQMPGQCSPAPASISEAMRRGFEAVSAFVTRHGLAMNGQPRAIYNSYGAGGVAFTIAVPVVSAPEGVVDEQIFVDTLPAVKAYRFTHHGPYANLAQTYNLITAFLKEKGLIETEADWARYMPMWEEYLNNPATTPATELITFIYLPVSPVE